MGCTTVGGRALEQPWVQESVWVCCGVSGGVIGVEWLIGVFSGAWKFNGQFFLLVWGERERERERDLFFSFSFK